MLKTERNKQAAYTLVLAMFASFVTYLSMYAFRKPITAATFEGITFWGFHYKSLVIITQVIGYLLSKLYGIKYISELKNQNRIKLLFKLIFLSYLGLFLFAIFPKPYNIFWMLLNGFPLGFIWGIVFSYLEGRKTTDLLACFLSISFVLGSGLVKSIGIWLTKTINIDEIWMPFCVASIFLPLIIFSGILLNKIPLPNNEDKLIRSERVPMVFKDRTYLINKYGFGLIPIFVFSMIITVNRDIKDNFWVEILNQFGIIQDNSIYIKIEFFVSLFLLSILSLLIFIKNNSKAFIVIHLLMLTGLLLVLLAIFQIDNDTEHLLFWLIIHGIGLYLTYILLQSLYFERFIAFFKIKANVGFFIYIVDFCGYLASCIIIIYKEIYQINNDWSNFFIKMNYFYACAGLFLISVAMTYFIRKKPVNAT